MMDVNAVPESAAGYAPMLRRIQKHLARSNVPFEIRLWGGHGYRFGEGDPTVDILVRDQKGLTALGRLDELGICEAYMTGSLAELLTVKIRSQAPDSSLCDSFGHI